MLSAVESKSDRSLFQKKRRILVQRTLIAALIFFCVAIVYSFFLVFQFHTAITALQKQDADMLVAYENNQGETVLESYGAVSGPSFIPAPFFRYHRSLYYIGLRRQPNCSPAEIDQLFSLFQQFPKLEELELEGFLINQKRAAVISRFSNLETVFLKRCQIEQSCLASILNRNGLTYINLSESDFEEEELEVLSQGSAKKSLISLSLSYCHVTDQSASLISRFQNLELLELDGTQISDQGLKELARLPKLRILVLDHTSVTDSGISCLSSTSQLVELSLSNTSVSDAVLEALKQEIPALQVSDD